MTEQEKPLDYAQLLTLWEIAGKPLNDDELLPLLSAASSEAKVQFWTALAEDEDWEFREGIAEDPTTPVEVLAQLASDEEPWVREAVANNPNTPEGVLAELSKDEEGDVRCAVSCNPNTPAKVLSFLVGDRSDDVSRGAVETLEILRRQPSTPNAPSSEQEVEVTVTLRLALPEGAEFVYDFKGEPYGFTRPGLDGTYTPILGWHINGGVGDYIIVKDSDFAVHGIDSIDYVDRYPTFETHDEVQTDREAHS